MNNNYFGTHLPPEQMQQMQRQLAASQQNVGADITMDGGMTGQSSSSMPQDDPMSAILDSPMLDGGDSLDDIIRQNSKELHRRRSLPQSYPAQTHQGSPGDDGGRRMSLMEFGSGSDPFRDFQFGDNLGGMQRDPMTDPGFASLDMAAAGNFSQSNMMGMSSSGGFAPLSPEMMGNMVAFSNLNMNNQMGGTGAPSMGTMRATASLEDQLMSNMSNGGGLDQMTTDGFGMDMMPDGLPGTGESSPLVRHGVDAGEDTEMMNASRGLGPPTHMTQSRGNQPRMHFQQPPSISREPSFQSPTSVAAVPSVRSTPTLTTGAATTGALTAEISGGGGRGDGGGGAPSTPAQTTLQPQTPQPPTQPARPQQPPAKNIYSKSGFDMIRALYYVASRENPQVQLGAVDMSCAFVICDVQLNDCPIVYVSENFQNLTGYSQHDILGKNCRFLQSPDGQVEAGIKREFVEDHAVFNLKRAIAERREIQQSLINYRKGGKPFLNLLTMIPIPWETKEMRFYIGFQIDIVECPDAISNPGQVDYARNSIPQYIWDGPQRPLPPGQVAGQASGSGGGPTTASAVTAVEAAVAAAAAAAADVDSGQTLSTDDISTLLRQFNGPKSGAVSDWHRQAWDKMLLENSDDVVHVLSLKGTFLYLSPSCKKILGYDASELVGNTQMNTLAGVCHPSDYIPVMRELKDGAGRDPPSFNLVFRIQQKTKGYAWFESRGTLFVEQGKGRKFIVLVGRTRPVFTLRRQDLEAHGGGIGDSELWTKLSTSGMFLFVASNIRSLLDLQPQELVGTSIQDLMRKESKSEFGRSIEKARKGRIVICRHEVQNRRGQVLQAQTILYPGDVPEGQKPSFLLAQTKLVKVSSRAIATAAQGGKQRTPSSTGATPQSSGPADAAAGGGEPDPSSANTSGTEPKSSATPIGGVVIQGDPRAGGSLLMKYKAMDDNMFEEIKTTRCTSWQYELRQMEKSNRIKAEELGQLLSNKKKRKRRRSAGLVRDCANCHTRSTPEWRRGPSGQRDLCNSCGLRWAKQNGRVSPRASSRGGNDAQSKLSNSPHHQSPLQKDFPSNETPGSAGATTPKARSDSGGVGRAVSVSTSAADPSPSPASALTPTTATPGGGGAATGVSPLAVQPPPLQEMDSDTTAVGTAGDGGSTPTAPSLPSIPPQSHPLLEGGSGLGGSGMFMTAISEETEG